MAKKRTKLSDLTQFNEQGLRRTMIIQAVFAGLLVMNILSIGGVLYMQFMTSAKPEIVLPYIAAALAGAGFSLIACMFAILYCLNSIFPKDGE